MDDSNPDVKYQQQQQQLYIYIIKKKRWNEGKRWCDASNDGDWEKKTMDRKEFQHEARIKQKQNKQNKYFDIFTQNKLHGSLTIYSYITIVYCTIV